MASSLLRHTILAVAISKIIWVYIDTPKSVYFCPLSPGGLRSDWTDENCYFSTSYAEAREKFIALGTGLREQVAASGRGGELLDLLDVQSISYDIANADQYKSLQPINASTPHTISPEKDTIDAILLTMRVPDEHYVDIIHSSGTHGVEGYLGSAIQIRFLHELFLQNEEAVQHNNKSPSESSGKVRKILLIHAINPFGMRHFRRCNENNVDLNRNVLGAEEAKTVIERDPNHFGYVDMDSALNPVSSSAVSKQQRNDLPIITTYMQELVAITTCVGSIVKVILMKGYYNAKRTIVSAQYHKQTGIFYGGSGQWEASIFAIQHAIDEFAGFRFTSSKTEQSEPLQTTDTQQTVASTPTFWIDVHTGLGKYGKYTVIQKERPENNVPWISQLSSVIRGLEYKQANNGKAVSAGYEQTIGFVNGDLLCPSPSCFSITQEFGSRSGVAVVLALILENKGFNWGNYEFAYLTSNAFQPQRLSWRRTTLRGGMETLHAATQFKLSPTQ
jgi:hypothetical protein